MKIKYRTCWICGLFLISLALYACQPLSNPVSGSPLATGTSVAETTASPLTATLLPTRPPYNPGELVDYIAQTGDTLPALAAHFNTTIEEILSANTFIPVDATTMPPGMPMRIPIYYIPFWGSPYQIIPDSLYVNGPAQIGFNTSEFLASQPGWLKDYSEYAFDGKRSGAEIIDYVARNFSISPRLLLALLEYQGGALSQPTQPADQPDYILGIIDYSYRGLYMQLVATANLLNNGYYGWRTGTLNSFEHPDGRVERPDPWQNAASVALQYYFSRLDLPFNYQLAVAHDGLAHIYREYFGDPWQNVVAHLPGGLTQPEFNLPFKPGITWALTGGPHPGWGDGVPFSALDFAPGAVQGGCTPTTEWATAVAQGVIVRSEPAAVVLDTDGDGDERTGWAVFYFHIGTEGRSVMGSRVQIGDPIGHPSCEGGRATGTHVHIARKYNGEWIPAGGILAFNLEGWVAQNGRQAYQGTLKRGSHEVIACTCADQSSQIDATQP